ncbi:GNAT family N-acetyltransferase [candidate division KSB1 bacterium]|nr:GNAT family N-acetyltransferase [candidate division KSB1 bacterium]
MSDFPKSIQLKDGTIASLHVMLESDLDNVIKFFQSIPDEDRLYLRSDTKNPENVRRRFGKLDYDLKYPLLVKIDDQIIGMATLFRSEYGWMRHLGEIRVVITQDYQRKGLATILTRELFFQALKRKLHKIQAELMDTQLSAITAFERLGFRKEATLKKHVTDVKGVRRDLIIMTLDVEDLWYLIDDYVKTPDFRIH